MMTDEARVTPAHAATAVLFAVLLAGSTPASENWPEFRGPTSDGHSDAERVPRAWSETKNVKWKTRIHGRAWSSPVVWGPQVWMTTATEDGRKMYGICVDRASGKIVRDLLLFTNEEPRFCHQFNSYASPSPVIEAGRVYLHFGSYGTACLDTESFATIWTRRDFECDHFRGPGSSPIIFEDLLITHYDGADLQYVVAQDKLTGRTVWRTDRSNDFGTDNGDFKKAYSTPIVIEAAGRRQLISTGSKAAMAYDPRTGRELWQINFEDFSGTARPLFGHGLVYINTGFSKADLLAVRPDGTGNVTDSHVVWSVKKGVPSKPSQLLIGDLIFMVNDGGIATCLDAKTGEQIWVQRIEGAYSASPIFAGGAMYCFSEEGRTTVIEPAREYRELAVNHLEDGFMASPAVAGRALYLRTRTHLYRIEE